VELFEPSDDLQFMLDEAKISVQTWVQNATCCVDENNNAGQLKVPPLTAAGALLSSSRLSGKLIRQAHRLKE
jgi:hypothetical protein